MATAPTCSTCRSSWPTSSSAIGLPTRRSTGIARSSPCTARTTPSRRRAWRIWSTKSTAPAATSSSGSKPSRITRPVTMGRRRSTSGIGRPRPGAASCAPERAPTCSWGSRRPGLTSKPRQRARSVSSSATRSRWPPSTATPGRRGSSSLPGAGSSITRPTTRSAAVRTMKWSARSSPGSPRRSSSRGASSGRP